MFQNHVTRESTWIRIQVVKLVMQTPTVPQTINKRSVLIVRQEKEWLLELELKKVTASGVS